MAFAAITQIGKCMPMAACAAQFHLQNKGNVSNLFPRQVDHRKPLQKGAENAKSIRIGVEKDDYQIANLHPDSNCALTGA